MKRLRAGSQALLRDALNLDPTDFFVSSQGGRGVAPAANIREEILKTLSDAPVAHGAGHAASRPGGPGSGSRPDTGSAVPIAATRSFSYRRSATSSLLQPVSDLRCICLDDDDDLHEMVKAVGASVGKPAADVLSYKPALAELALGRRRRPLGGRRARAVAWLRWNAHRPADRDGRAERRLVSTRNAGTRHRRREPRPQTPSEGSRSWRADERRQRGGQRGSLEDGGALSSAQGRGACPTTDAGRAVRMSWRRCSTKLARPARRRTASSTTTT